MNMIPSVTKLLLEIVYVNEKREFKPICIIETPSIQPVPKVGDEVSIPHSIEEKIGTKNTIFRVTKRRFPIQTDGISYTKVVLFVSSELESP